MSKKDFFSKMWVFYNVCHVIKWAILKLDLFFFTHLGALSILFSRKIYFAIFHLLVREKRKQASRRKSGNDIDVLSTHPELHSKLDHIFWQILTSLRRLSMCLFLMDPARPFYPIVKTISYWPYRAHLIFGFCRCCHQTKV